MIASQSLGEGEVDLCVNNFVFYANVTYSPIQTLLSAIRQRHQITNKGEYIRHLTSVMQLLSALKRKGYN